jgi:hypothetical protein
VAVAIRLMVVAVVVVVAVGVCGGAGCLGDSGSGGVGVRWQWQSWSRLCCLLQGHWQWWWWWLLCGWLLWHWHVLWPPRGHGCSMDDSGWPWMTVVCAFLLATGGGGKGGQWWWWLWLQGQCWSGCDLLLRLRWRSWWQFCCQCGLWSLLHLRIGGQARMHRLRRQGLLKVIGRWSVLVRGYEMKIV